MIIDHPIYEKFYFFNIKVMAPAHDPKKFGRGKRTPQYVINSHDFHWNVNIFSFHIREPVKNVLADFAR